ncbi:MAG: AAA family ATPase, partial [Bdellovibrionales bacterium]
MSQAIFARFARILFFVAIAMAFTLTVLSSQSHAQNQTGVDKDKNPTTVEPKPSPEEALARFTTNLTEMAKSPNAKPYIGNRAAIRKVLETLGKQGNKIIYLTGGPGSGKSALMEALAPYLGDVVLYRLELKQLEGGTGIRGTQENRMLGLIEAFHNNDKRILVIDEAHTIMSNKDFMNFLKPIMGRGEIRMMLGTTDEEYRKDIEPDQALTSRGNREMLADPTEADIVNVLRALKDSLQKAHGIPVTDAALKMAAKLTLRYFPYEPAYRKAYDIVDRTMVREVLNRKFGNFDNLHLHDAKQAFELEKKSLEADLDHNLTNHQELRDRITELNDEIKVIDDKLDKAGAKDNQDMLSARLSQLQREANEAEKAGNQLQRVAELRGVIIPKIEKDLRNLGVEPQNNDVISEDHIAKFVSTENGIPVSNLRESDMERSIRLEALLNQRVKGQREANKKIAESIRVGAANVDEQKGPRDVILLTGSSGVGKNEIVNTLGIGIYDDIRKVVRIDMGQMGPHSSMNLLGAGPGLVNSDQAGLLEPVRLDGYVILNLDEMNLADRSMDNLIMAALDRGEMKDAMGRMINFRNCTVIITANWAEEYALNKGKWSTDQIEKFYRLPTGSLEGLRSEEIDRIVIDRAMELAGVRPAMRNRLRTKILVNTVNFDDAVEIARTRLADQKDYLYKEHKVTIVWDDNVAVALAKQSFDPVAGARSIDQARRDTISTLLADLHFEENGFKKGDVLDVKFVPDAEG